MTAQPARCSQSSLSRRKYRPTRATSSASRRIRPPTSTSSNRSGFAWTTATSAAPASTVLSLYDARFAPGDVLVFGCETAGLPQSILDQFGEDRRLAIPMRPGVRSLNLSNAVAVSVYEAWRQQGFAMPAEAL